MMVYVFIDFCVCNPIFTPPHNNKTCHVMLDICKYISYKINVNLSARRRRYGISVARGNDYMFLFTNGFIEFCGVLQAGKSHSNIGAKEDDVVTMIQVANTVNRVSIHKHMQGPEVKTTTIEGPAHIVIKENDGAKVTEDVPKGETIEISFYGRFTFAKNHVFQKFKSCKKQSSRAKI